MYYVNNGDNFHKLFTLFINFIHSRIFRRRTGNVTAHRLALEFEAICVVNETIQDRVGVSGILDSVMMPLSSIGLCVGCQP